MKTIAFFSRGLLIFMLITAFIVGLGFTLGAQKQNYDSNLYNTNYKKHYEDITINLDVTLDGKKVELDDLQVTMMNVTKDVVHSVQTSHSISLFLEYGQNYMLCIGRKGYNNRVVAINTDAPTTERFVISLEMDLKYGAEDELAGIIFYNYDTGKYESRRHSDIIKAGIKNTSK